MPVESIDNKVEIEFRVSLFHFFLLIHFYCVLQKYSSMKDWKKKVHPFNSGNSEAFPWAEHVAVFQKEFLDNQGRYKMPALVIHVI